MSLCYGTSCPKIPPMKTSPAKRPTPAELTARRKAYAALAAAYDRDPAQALFLDQIRRDVAAAHRFLQKQKEPTP
jgi:hypothetical protein